MIDFIDNFHWIIHTQSRLVSEWKVQSTAFCHHVYRKGRNYEFLNHEDGRLQEEVVDLIRALQTLQKAMSVGLRFELEPATTKKDFHPEHCFQLTCHEFKSWVIMSLNGVPVVLIIFSLNELIEIHTLKLFLKYSEFLEISFPVGSRC